jgi:hypothetical protein
MQTITTEIEISAPPKKVWEVISNIENWQEWNPIIFKASGSNKVGSVLDITMMGKKEGSTGPKYKPVILAIEENQLLHWRAHMMAGFIFTNDKIIELIETNNGTKIIHKETFKGLMASLFCSQMEKSVPKMLNTMNEALKKISEK